MFLDLSKSSPDTKFLNVKIPQKHLKTEEMKNVCDPCLKLLIFIIFLILDETEIEKMEIKIKTEPRFGCAMRPPLLSLSSWANLLVASSAVGRQ